MDDRAIFLLNIKYIFKHYEKEINRFCREKGHTQTELQVIGFLAGSGKKDTATGVVDCFHLSKASVSNAVESLAANKLLIPIPDEHDRRCVHLRLTPEAYDLRREMSAFRREVEGKLLSGFTEDEMNDLAEFSRRVQKIVDKQLAEEQAEKIELTY